MEKEIVIKYRINGALFRRKYSLSRAREAAAKIEQLRHNKVEVVSVKGLPQAVAP